MKTDANSDWAVGYSTCALRFSRYSDAANVAKATTANPLNSGTGMVGPRVLVEPLMIETS